MILVILVFFVLICLFVSIVNLFYQNEKYKYSTKEEMKNLPIFESPSTWRICIVVSALISVGAIVLCGKYIMNGFSYLGTQEENTNQSTTEQYQYDSLNQNTGNGQTN